MSAGEDSAATTAQQAALEITRQRLASEVDELVDRFRPTMIQKRVEARLRERLDDVLTYARRRPALVASIAVGGVLFAIWRLSRRRSDHPHR